MKIVIKWENLYKVIFKNYEVPPKVVYYKGSVFKFLEKRSGYAIYEFDTFSERFE